MDDEDPASDEEVEETPAEVEEIDWDLVPQEDPATDDEMGPIDDLYRSRSGVQWSDLPKTLLGKRKARNVLRHKGGPKVQPKTEVS